MTCTHPRGFQKIRCTCGLFFFRCPLCEQELRHCLSCASEPPTPHSHLVAMRKYGKAQYKQRHADQIKTYQAQYRDTSRFRAVQAKDMPDDDGHTD